ncbi:MAG: TetR/AcrR family transcriptional regulator [Tuberibacillus sp.]
MNDKKINIINAAMQLFSEKGVHATSMQEIADASNVSKGTIYTYFSSKDDLLLSIFNFYHENIKSHILDTSSESLSKDRFVHQIDTFIKERIQYKGIFKMIHREQLLTTRKDLHQVIVNIQFEILNWFRTILVEIYGERVTPYLPDGCFILESLISSYLKVLMFDESLVDVDHLAEFIVRRIDGMLNDMMDNGEQPVIPVDSFERVKSKYVINVPMENQLETLFKNMEETIRELQIPEEKRKELTDSLQFIKSETQKEERQNFLLRGVMANFNGFEELAGYRQKLQQWLDL